MFDFLKRKRKRKSSPRGRSRSESIKGHTPQVAFIDELSETHETKSKSFQWDSSSDSSGSSIGSSSGSDSSSSSCD